VLEDQHHLDLIMDSSRPHWDHINEILALYHSAILYSNGEYKIISDRADLPLRQVFERYKSIVVSLPQFWGLTQRQRIGLAFEVGVSIGRLWGSLRYLTLYP